MSASKKKSPGQPPVLKKCPSGVAGLDEITNGGLPAGRPILVCGGTGSGKTLLAMQFLVNGAIHHDEPGVFMSFEENEADLKANVASLGIDLETMAEEQKVLIDSVNVIRSEIDETGSYDLEGLFLRLGQDIDSIGAKRVVLDTIETLFASLADEGILRSELQRLFRWLKDKGVTTIITAERGDGTLTRHGLEEYVSDCVIVLDQRVTGQIATRRLRIVKYRGSGHQTNEYPFLLDDRGVTVVPVTSISLRYPVSDETVSTGIAKLDGMLGAGGYLRGSTILVTGTAGSGKTSVAAHFVDAACKRGERALHISFEETPEQVERNMRSIGIDLKKWLGKKLLRMEATRPLSHGLDEHLAMIRRAVDDFAPQVVAIDPISSLISPNNYIETKTILSCLVDLLKSRGITTLLTSLTEGEQTEMGLSSLADAWISLRNLEMGGEHTRVLYVLKARGMSHSNSVREFLLTSQGVKLIEVYVGPDGVLTGSARSVQEMRDRSAELAMLQESHRRRVQIDCKEAVLKSKIAELQAEFEAEKSAIETSIAESESINTNLSAARAQLFNEHGSSLKNQGAK